MCDQAAHPIQQRPNFGIEGRVVAIAAQVELQEVTDRAPYSRQPCNKESFKREEPVSPNDIQEKAGVLLKAGLPNQRFEIARGLVGRSQETLQGHTSIRHAATGTSEVLVKLLWNVFKAVGGGLPGRKSLSQRHPPRCSSAIQTQSLILGHDRSLCLSVLLCQVISEKM